MQDFETKFFFGHKYNDFYQENHQNSEFFFLKIQNHQISSSK
jgi:hypothetical protein